MQNRHFQVVIVGGGAAGLDVAARLVRTLGAGKIAIIEPSDKHYYQPMWTLVGGGEATPESTMRNEADLIPKGVEWVREAATELCPEEKYVVTDKMSRLTFEYLVVCPGIQVNWNGIPGLVDGLKSDPRVVSNYDYEYAPKTWRAIQDFKGGTAIFTQPLTPIKCGGAPQKIMYLAEDAWVRRGVRDKADIRAYFPQPAVFGAAHFVPALMAVIERKNISLTLRRNVIEIRHADSIAVVQNVDEPDQKEEVKYDFIHVTPPMSAPDFIRESSLAHADGPLKGWVEVDKNTLQHTRFPHVFSLGDCAGLPTSKTGAAIRKQAVVLEHNLLAAMGEKPLPDAYDGYTSCPLVTGYGKLIMAEFDYEGKPQPSFPLDPTKERWSMYMVKKHMLPRLYWDFMIKGKA